MKNKDLNSKYWKKLIENDLGEKKTSSLFMNSIEGIDILPYYTENNCYNNDFIFPDEWKILGEIKFINKKKFIEEINLLKKCNFSHVNLVNFNEKKIKQLLNSLKNIEINLNCESENREDLSFKLIRSLKKTFKPDLLSFGSITITNLNKTDFDINLSSDKIKNNGCSIIQEIAFVLSSAIELLNANDKSIIRKINFEFVQGSNYFFEIAKIQAVRLLWALLTKEYGDMYPDCIITTKPFLKNKTIKNFNNNIIRSTAECMSGILGGCNFVKSVAYDRLFMERNLFSQKIKNHQLLILKNETFIDKTANSIEGSYYIKYLVDKVAEESLKLIKEIDSMGGYKSCLKNGWIKKQIKENELKENEMYIRKKRILVGVNKYNEEENKISNTDNTSKIKSQLHLKTIEDLNFD